jgi:hypothetical protein
VASSFARCETIVTADHAGPPPPTPPASRAGARCDPGVPPARGPGWTAGAVTRIGPTAGAADRIRFRVASPAINQSITNLITVHRMHTRQDTAKQQAD